MSQKKRKKHSTPTNVGKDPMKLQQTSKHKKADPLTRNLLLCDLVILAASQMMLDQDMISQGMADFCGVVGIILLIIALYLLFGPQKRINGTPKQ